MVFKKNKNCLFFSAHLGNWELTSHALTENGFNINFIYRAPNNKYIDILLRRIRLSYGVGLIKKGPEGARECIKVLSKDGGNIGMLIDQKMNDGISTKFFNKNVDGELELLKDFEPSGRGTVDADDLQGFLDTEIERVALDFGPNEVVLRREIAPGQTMEYYVLPDGDDGFKLVPLGDGDRAENAAIIIDEYNPSLIKIPVLKLPVEEKARGPLFLYRKKDGGKIASDGLVSITDIYGDY